MRDLPGKRAVGRRQRGASLELGFGVEQISESLGLGEVDPAIGQRAAGELARLGPPQPRYCRQRSFDGGHNGAPAMQM